ncbi:unnamed protein product [Blepharisma stoltei]|uniref:MICOS complex subunit MIC60 n=1 Tax=Blepharisma stoltei TaxID=1481888 RepID=A0AAU9ITI7_9CILI|nr:unnamed protein product [Blepharisma stoltei]
MWRGTRRQFSSPIVLLGASGGKRAIYTLAFAGISGIYGLFFERENKNQNNELQQPPLEYIKDPDFEETHHTNIEEFVFNQIPGINDKQRFMDFICENLNCSKLSIDINDKKSNSVAIDAENDTNKEVSFDNSKNDQNKNDKIEKATIVKAENLVKISEAKEESHENQSNLFIANGNQEKAHSFAELEKDLQKSENLNSEVIHKMISSSIEEYLQKLKQDLEKDHEEKELRNFNIFFEKSKEIKRSYKEKLKEVIKKHEEEMKMALEQRDHSWEERIEKEVTDAETHFWKQAKINESYIIQQATLELIEKHEQEIREINKKFEKITEERLKQLDEILGKINDMESSQKRHYNIISKLNQVHELHIHIENLQRKVNSGQETLNYDLAALKDLAKEDEKINSVLASIEDDYKEIIEHGIPTMSQLLKVFKEFANNNKKNTPLKSDNWWSYLSTSFTYLFTRSNKEETDRKGNLLLLQEAESALEKGDLKAFTHNLESLKGLKQEEFSKILKDAFLRQRFLNFLEILSSESISLVKSLTSQ